MRSTENSLVYDTHNSYCPISQVKNLADEAMRISQKFWKSPKSDFKLMEIFESSYDLTLFNYSDSKGSCSDKTQKAEKQKTNSKPSYEN